MSWSSEFEAPTPLPKGKPLVTLRDAASYIMKLPKREQDLPHWQTATAELLQACEKGPTMLARIAVMRAINHGKAIALRDRRARVNRIIS